MKLELVKSWISNDIQYVCSNIALDSSTLIVLAINNADKYSLIVLQQEKMIPIPLPYLDSFLDNNDEPILFSIGGNFGIIATITELYHYSNFDAKPEKITISNGGFFTKKIPKTARKRKISPISDSNILPICFEDKLFQNHARYYGLLEVDIRKKSAAWLNFSNIESDTFPFHTDKDHPPKIDSLQLLKNELYAFVAGGNVTSVNKWGMDYYGLVKITKQGKVLETYIDSGNLKIDNKKRGVNGLFTANEEYLIMTPVFQNDEWKGIQKIYSLKTKEYVEIELPQGKTKFKIIQNIANSFWIYLHDKEQKQFALCRT